MKIQLNSVAVIDYTLRDKSGQVIDSSRGHDPLAYIHGIGNIIPGLEEALTGKGKGDSVKVEIPPEKAYGTRDDSLTMVLPRDSFEGVDDIEIGMSFQADGPDGERVITVIAMEGDDITVDGNHPLAGETLFFEVDIVEVRTATSEELNHGHVHGPGGHHHH